MKGLKIAIIALMIAGWSCAFLGLMDGSEKEQNSTTEYEECIEIAQEYASRALYQKAIVKFEEAVEQKNKEEDWFSLLEMYEARYQEDDDIAQDYIKAAKKAVKEYDENVSFYKILTNICIVEEDYRTAYNMLEKAVDEGTTEEGILQLYEKVKYACVLDGKSYHGIRSLCNENYAVLSQESWGLLSQEKKTTVKSKYIMIGDMSEQQGIYVFSDGVISGVMDEEDVLQGRFDFIPEAAGVYADELLPVKYQGRWAYYDILGDKQFGDYLEAGAFQDKKAAVKNEEGWFLIDAEGDRISDVYEEIRINPDGSYLKEDVMLAKKDGQWRLFDEDEKVIGDFACEEFDIVTESGLIAFKQNEKWGYVDLEGEIVIEPEYENAKSFSEGLAAVYVDLWWGFINEENKLVIKPTYLGADYFNEEGSCMVQTTENTWQLLERYINE